VDWHQETLSLLLRGWADMDRDRQPYLALRGGLALVEALARVERPERAQGVLAETYTLFREVTDPEEKLRVCWWEARALASLGRAEEALEILKAVRIQLVAENCPAEEALVSLDLVIAHAAAGRIEELGSLAGELESSVPKNRALALAAEKIGFSARLAVQGDPRLPKSVSASGALLRRTFRASGLRIKPLLMA